MRLILTIAGCCVSLLGFSQAKPQFVRIQLSYENAGQYLEQAVETLEAVNTVGRMSTVSYEAGRAVTLLPGFQAQSGSVFTASIKPVFSQQDVALKLKAFPNPVDQSTTISYYLPTDGKVNLWITDSQGKTIKKLVMDENQSAGAHQIEWEPGVVNPGIYIPIVESNQQRAVSRIVKK